LNFLPLPQGQGSFLPAGMRPGCYHPGHRPPYPWRPGGGRLKDTKAKKAKGKLKTEAPANGHAELLRQLFQAAIKLRASIEPADYKRYVLPIIFLRFLSLRYERRREELKRLIDDPQSDYYQLAAVLDEDDEYRAAGAFPVPEKARWSTILKHAQADDIKQSVPTTTP